MLPCEASNRLICGRPIKARISSQCVALILFIIDVLFTSETPSVLLMLRVAHLLALDRGQVLLVCFTHIWKPRHRVLIITGPNWQSPKALKIGREKEQALLALHHIIVSTIIRLHLFLYSN